MSIKKRNLSFALISIAICFSLEAKSGPLDEIRVARAKQLCEEKGKIISDGTVSAESYMITKELNSNRAFGFDEIAKELLGKRFSFIELEPNYGASSPKKSEEEKPKEYIRYF